MYKKVENLERICYNCNYFFTASIDEATEYGFCLKEPVFEPYVDHILEEGDLSQCLLLIAEKKFIGDRDGCEHYEAIELYDIEDDSHLGQEITRLKKGEILTLKSLETAVILDELEKIDWKHVPIDHHVRNLQYTDRKKQMHALENLCGLAGLGNEAARQQVLDFFQNLPVPQTLADVHYKRDLFQKFCHWKTTPQIVAMLVHELAQIESNNTTRHWITQILDYLQHCPFELVHDPLDQLLKQRKFSIRLQRRIEDLLFELE
ncbi:hypothetical protein L0128_13310 [candidate division KSB1 bacterium]|nr:hypothetical protein [candidate division KSB1 bacterium]